MPSMQRIHAADATSGVGQRRTSAETNLRAYQYSRKIMCGDCCPVKPQVILVFELHNSVTSRPPGAPRACPELVEGSHRLCETWEGPSRIERTRCGSPLRVFLFNWSSGLSTCRREDRRPMGHRTSHCWRTLPRRRWKAFPWRRNTTTRRLTPVGHR
jgi:hypothetical protein